MRRRIGFRIPPVGTRGVSEEVDEVIMGDPSSWNGTVERSKSPISASDLELEQIRAAVRGIRFGEVRVIIQDGRIIQIERLEKQRFR